MNFQLPKNYKSREDSNEYQDIVSNYIYQPHVYELAKFIADRSSIEWIIDIGCGSGQKLKDISNKFKIIGVDAAVGLNIARSVLPNAEFIECDLENGIPKIDKSILKKSIIICSDVIEHLLDPTKLLNSLSLISKTAPYVLISTPDRDRARGWLDQGPPPNIAHVREWGASEFLRLLSAYDIESTVFGHTINTDYHKSKSTLLAMSGAEVSSPGIFPDFKVAAIIHTFNEVDIIEETVNHLNNQNIEVHVFDNWSTDGTFEKLNTLMHSGKLKFLSKFPNVQRDYYDWHAQLDMTSAYSKSLDSDWVLHYDADEIRYSPWARVSLRDAIGRVNELGYNAIDFTVLDFRFLRDIKQLNGTYQESLNHFEFGKRPGHFLQVKGWKNNSKVDLASSGGHEAQYENRRIFPLKFLTKHYPLRSIEQAIKKISTDRLPRFGVEKEKFGWHTQYDKFIDKEDIEGWESSLLIPWHASFFYNEYVVERISGIGLKNSNLD